MTVQNRYVGDLGDFGKFGLLRALCSSSEPAGVSPLSLGIVWYLVPDETHNTDGRFVDFLDLSSRNQERFRACDPSLYDALRRIVFSGERNVASIRGCNILPRTTRFYDDVLTFEDLRGAGVRISRLRAQRRTLWLEGALRATEGCDVVFLDPDNGLEVGVGSHQLRGPKYAFFDELLPFVQRDQSLLIYHHIARRGTALDQVTGRMAQIEDRLGRSAFALLYHRGSARAFFVVPAQRQWEVLSSRARTFMESRWARHFEIVRQA